MLTTEPIALQCVQEIGCVTYMETTPKITISLLAMFCKSRLRGYILATGETKAADQTSVLSFVPFEREQVPLKCLCPYFSIHKNVL